MWSLTIFSRFVGDIFQDLFCTNARFSRAIKFKIIFIFFQVNFCEIKTSFGM